VKATRDAIRWVKCLRDTLWQTTRTDPKWATLETVNARPEKPKTRRTRDYYYYYYCYYYYYYYYY